MSKSSKHGVKCKKHPKHRQSPGVCSICLNEKLSQLSSGSGSRRNSDTAGSGSCSSSPSSLSSYDSSSCSSPVHFTNLEGKIISSLSFLLNGKNVLTKSRSLVFFPRMNRPRTGDNDHDDMKKDDQKKGRGFWSKFLRATSKIRTDETFMRSWTVREIVMTTD